MREKERMTGGKISTRDSEKRQNVKKMGEQKGLRKEGAMTRRKILHFRERKRKIGR